MWVGIVASACISLNLKWGGTFQQETQACCCCAGLGFLGLVMLGTGLLCTRPAVKRFRHIVPEPCRARIAGVMYTERLVHTEVPASPLKPSGDGCPPSATTTSSPVSARNEVPGKILPKAPRPKPQKPQSQSLRSRNQQL